MKEIKDPLKNIRRKSSSNFQIIDTLNTKSSKALIGFAFLSFSLLYKLKPTI